MIIRRFPFSLELFGENHYVRENLQMKIFFLHFYLLKVIFGHIS